MTQPEKPQDPNVLVEEKPSFVIWYLQQERKLVNAASAAGFTDIEIIGFDKYPAGNWTHKKVLKASGQVIARYWLSLRRTGKSRKLRVPKFNLECGRELSRAFGRGKGTSTEIL